MTFEPGKPNPGFKKGQSGNPGGKPKVPPDVQQLLKAATPRATRTLIGLMGSKDEAIRLRAAEAIMNRVFGTPRQSVELAGEAVRFVMRLPVPIDTDEWEKQGQAYLEGGGRWARPVTPLVEPAAKPVDTTDPRLPVQFTGIRTPRSS